MHLNFWMGQEFNVGSGYNMDTVKRLYQMRQNSFAGERVAPNYDYVVTQDLSQHGPIESYKSVGTILPSANIFCDPLLRILSYSLTIIRIVQPVNAFLE